MWDFSSVQTLECPPPRVDRKENRGLWLRMMSQRRFVDGNRQTAPVPDVHSQEGCACVGAGQRANGKSLYCEAKTALKKNLNLKLI